MILTGHEINKQIESKKIIITPYDKTHINPNSYDLTLAPEYKIYTSELLDVQNQNETESYIMPEYGMILLPQQLYLMRTNEKTSTNFYAPMLEGRSSLARLGIFIHITAGFGDVGFNGHWTLEVSCLKPIRILPNIRIAQIYFHTLQGNNSILYKGKYQDNNGIQSSKIHLDKEIK